MVQHITTNDLAENDLSGRLNLIETMIAEGRQTTESWGWTFVLWGVAYYVAIAWSMWSGHSSIAWPVTMLSAAAITGIVASRQGKREPETTIGRAISAIWMCVGISLFVFCLCISLSGHAEQHAFLAVIEVMLGCANATSAMILKWRTQFLAALVWWVAGVISCFGSVTQSSVCFLVAIFFGQIVFGTYMMISEAQEKKQHAQRSGAAHV